MWLSEIAIPFQRQITGNFSGKGSVLQRCKNKTKIFQGVILALFITKASKDKCQASIFFH